MVSGGGVNCNVWTYNYSREQHSTKNVGGIEVTYSDRDLDLHAKYPYGNLYEQNYVKYIEADDYHGWNGPYNAFIRNYCYDDQNSNWGYINLLNAPNSSVLGCEVQSPTGGIGGGGNTTFAIEKYGKFSDGSIPITEYESMPWKTHYQVYLNSLYRMGSYMLDLSYYYSEPPDFLNEAGLTFPSIGPNWYWHSQNIPAKIRYQNAEYTYNPNPSQEAQPVSGIQSGNWSGCKVVKGDVTVPSGSTLNISPGTVIVFDGNYKIRINDGGHIYAQGTETEPVLFTLSSSGGDEWKYVQVKSGGNIFQHCLFEKAMSPLYLYFANESENTIENCTFRDNRLYGLRLYKSLAMVTGCEMKNNGYYGVYGYNNGLVKLAGVHIHDNQSAGIYTYTNSYFRLYGSLIDNNNTYGIYTKNGDFLHAGASWYRGLNTITDNGEDEIYLGPGNPDGDIWFSSVHDDDDCYEVYNVAENTSNALSFSAYFGEDLECDVFGDFYEVGSLQYEPYWEGKIMTDSIPYMGKCSSVFNEEPAITQADKNKAEKYKIIIDDPSKTQKEMQDALDSLYTMVRLDYVSDGLGEKEGFAEYLKDLKNDNRQSDLGKQALWYLILWEILECRDAEVIALSEEALKIFDDEYRALILENLAITCAHAGMIKEAEKTLKDYRKSPHADEEAAALIEMDIADIREELAKGTFQPHEPLSNADAPAVFALGQNYPNPGNPVTTIHYSLAHPGRVTLDVYNILGQRVRRLMNRQEEAGSFTVTWDGRTDTGLALPSGVYVYTLRAGGKVLSKKLMWLK